MAIKNKEIYAFIKKSIPEPMFKDLLQMDAPDFNKKWAQRVKDIDEERKRKGGRHDRN